MSTTIAHTARWELLSVSVACYTLVLNRQMLELHMVLSLAEVDLLFSYSLLHVRFSLIGFLLYLMQ